ncbi:MAG: FAD-dependent monooxygenase [Dehalococcoidia bacterium]
MNDARASDVLVVGGGPAGSVTRRCCWRAPARVTLLDRATFPRDKPCAEYLSPGALAALHEIGAGRPGRGRRRSAVDPVPAERLRPRVHARPLGGAPHWPNIPAHGLGLRRATLDAFLLTMARGAGVRCTRTSALLTCSARTRRVTGVRALGPDGPLTRRAAIVVGADGVNGIVGRRLAMTALRSDLRRFALVGHMRGIAGLGDCGEMHVGPAGLRHRPARPRRGQTWRWCCRHEPAGGPAATWPGSSRALLEFTDLARAARSAKLLEPPLQPVRSP